ncbi:MAG: BT_3928 family protein [Bacteroidota bacterium]
MKAAVTIARILVGGLFIFSGLVKAIDPLGLSYKMEEFFEVWGRTSFLTGIMSWLGEYSFWFSVIMITLEVALGVALLVGWNRKLILRLLLLLILFFTFLTSYVLFTDKIRACGCFGDCIPLTPIQTFSKDIILLLLVIFLIQKRKYIEPVLKSPVPFLFVLVSVIATGLLQMNVVEHLPLVDCLPFKKGNDILELRKMPKDAVPDKFEYVFVYEKDNVQKEFSMTQLPDSTWKFKDRKQILIEKGKNNVALINDFSLTAADGGDSTETILNKEHYYLFFIKNMEEAVVDRWQNIFRDVVKKAKEKNMMIYVVTSDTKDADGFFNQVNNYNLPIFTTDGIAIKTAARATPTIFEMKGPVVQQKYSWADLDELIK